jgi:hypothetical protein
MWLIEQFSRARFHVESEGALARVVVTPRV